jgi:hypothetical protein
MREICMSGSTRGQWVAAGRRSLSYSTGPFYLPLVRLLGCFSTRILAADEHG